MGSFSLFHSGPFVVSIFAYKLFNVPLDFGVCMCARVSEAVFHSIQIRAQKKRNRSEGGRRRRSRRLCRLPISFFLHIAINHKRADRVSRFFLVHRITHREEWEREKKNPNTHVQSNTSYRTVWDMWYPSRSEEKKVLLLEWIILDKQICPIGLSRQIIW